MTLVHAIEALSIAGALAALGVAAVKDAREYRIPNTTVLCLVAAFVPYAAVQGSWMFVVWALAAGAAMFAVCAGMFAMRMVGGGDAKLIAAMALWTQFAAMPRFFIVMALTGGVLSGVYLVTRRLARRSTAPDPSAAPAEAQSQKIPYGVAIALAGLDFFLLAPNGPVANLIS
jgi:prepilin peptidase CpaA